MLPESPSKYVVYKNISYHVVAANSNLTNQKPTGGGGIIQASAVPVKCKKMAKTSPTLDKLVRFLKVETIFIYSSKLKSKTTVVFGMFKFINKLV